jgi:hypothetical protein
MPGDAAPDSEDKIGSDDEDDDEMKDVSPVKLVALVPDDYDEEAATVAALAALKAHEDSKWSWLGWRTSANSRQWWRSTLPPCRHHHCCPTRHHRWHGMAMRSHLLRSTRCQPHHRSTRNKP